MWGVPLPASFAGLQHGFESVRDTIERNFDQLRDVLGHYGIEMSQDAALRRARELREERGWDSVEDAPREAPDGSLRLVGA